MTIATTRFEQQRRQERPNAVDTHEPTNNQFGSESLSLGFDIDAPIAS